MKVFLLAIGVISLSYFVIISGIDIYLIGFAKPMFQLKLNKKQYMIKKKNRIDFQGSNECSGSSSAYVLRHFGIDAQGKEVYRKMPFKMSDGYVYPKSIPKVFADYGITVKYFRGNINAVKNILSKGNPVILLMRYRTDKDWLQYLTLVGYDEKYIYTADSHEEKVNCVTNKYYNDRIEIAEFKKLWNTSNLKMPFYRNTFFAIK